MREQRGRLKLTGALLLPDTAGSCTAGGNPDSNTLLSDMTTVICLDDYHSLDRCAAAEAGAGRPICQHSHPGP
jgi:hypothetical protein